MDLDSLKKKLKDYKEDEIKFSKHAEFQILLRDGSKKDVINNLLNPEKLIDFEEELKDIKYKLYFDISNSRTMILPVIMKEKLLYIVTYIMRYRSWKRALKKRYGKKW